MYEIYDNIYIYILIYSHGLLRRFYPLNPYESSTNDNPNKHVQAGGVQSHDGHQRLGRKLWDSPG